MNTAKPNYLPKHVTWHYENTAITLAESLARAIAQCLNQALQHRPRASLAVSGGRTPSAMFTALSQQNIAWHRIDITLVDERWVDESHSASNAALVRQHLLQNAASAAHFTPLFNSAASNLDGCLDCHQQLSNISRPIDVVVLGMGNDGHTASLFPNCPHLAHAMADTNTSICAATTAPTEPQQRITLTAQQLHLARHKFLHLVGADKLQTLQQAMHLRSPSKMPIFAFLQRPLSIYWSA